ncbi:MAG: NAD(P)/FAD-dependent oxidoreductase [Burkholderiales bacterium]|nr:NAD(P)/FAD-dependent oxidoreductase [Burkholderiales bacterium]MBH2016367.1 NAD(P)/FAD-dependent oxidoreductase [Burkholderiales bacterium]
MTKMKLVMVGNGMAGVRALEELLKIAPDLYEITVFGAEPHPNYNRILLSPVLAGEQTLDEIILNPLKWYADHGITLHTNKRVVHVDRRRRVVVAEDGTEAAYDRLLIATGSNPFILPVPGKDLDGVIAYRDIADTNFMIEAALTHQHAVVIGGGLLGLEAANGLMLRGMRVTVVHIAPWLMDRQLDEVASKLLQRSLEERGLSFRIGAQTQALIGTADEGRSGRVKAVRFKDGTEVPADLVVMAAGVRPSTELAEKIGLHCNRGIVVSDTMQTITDPRVYAVGECAAHRGIAYGLVAPLFEQGKVVANHLAEFGIGRYGGSQVSTKLKVTGIDLFSAGDFMGGEGTEAIVLSDPIHGVYKKLVLKGDKLVGACLYGDTADGSHYFKLIREGLSIRGQRDRLMFGETALA